mmetsp:Transcript_77348/g.230413  ORF Transcript_77348/g.230413 Transcript_77348/m.230413 type:complete len:206 (-) Transcript_77348:324-941(-)
MCLPLARRPSRPRRCSGPGSAAKWSGACRKTCTQWWRTSWSRSWHSCSRLPKLPEPGSAAVASQPPASASSSAAGTPTLLSGCSPSSAALQTGTEGPPWPAPAPSVRPFSPTLCGVSGPGPRSASPLPPRGRSPPPSAPSAASPPWRSPAGCARRRRRAAPAASPSARPPRPPGPCERPPGPHARPAVPPRQQPRAAPDAQSRPP